jgi:surface protein
LLFCVTVFFCFFVCLFCLFVFVLLIHHVSLFCSVRAFSGATAFNSDIPKWEVSRVNDMYGMFPGATSFNNDISKWIFLGGLHLFVCWTGGLF